MDVIDCVPAHTLESGDLISLYDDEIEVREILEDSSPIGVSFTGYSRLHDSVETYEVPMDRLIDILGA